MIRSHRVLAAALAALLVASTVTARSLVDRLPSGAALLGSLDLDAVRKSPLLGPDKLSGPMPEQASGFDAILRDAGIDIRRDVAQVAFAVMPQREGGADGDVAMIASGRLDPAKLRAAAVAHGGTSTTLGDVAAVRLAKNPGDGDDATFLSFVDGLAVVGGAEATKLVHARSKAAESTVSRKPSGIPKDAAFWLAGDLGQVGSSDAVSAALPMIGQVQRIQIWARLAEALELNAIADAPDSAVATQIAGLAALAVGFAAIQGDTPQAALLSGVRVSAKDRRVTASLTLTKAQLDAASAASAPDAPKLTPEVEPKPAPAKALP